jgi:hypothetical protein
LFKLNQRFLFKWIISEYFMLKKETGNFWWFFSGRTCSYPINSKTIIERGEIVLNNNGFRLISQIFIIRFFKNKIFFNKINLFYPRIFITFFQIIKSCWCWDCWER